MITSFVVNSETKQPGQGFWGLDGIPASLQLFARDEEHLNAAAKDARRDIFWVQEMQRVNEFWKRPNSEEEIAPLVTPTLTQHQQETILDRWYEADAQVFNSIYKASTIGFRQAVLRW